MDDCNEKIDFHLCIAIGYLMRTLNEVAISRAPSCHRRGKITCPRCTFLGINLGNLGLTTTYPNSSWNPLEFRSYSSGISNLT